MLAFALLLLLFMLAAAIRLALFNHYSEHIHLLFSSAWHML